jgi:hypothetical protein
MAITNVMTDEQQHHEQRQGELGLEHARDERVDLAAEEARGRTEHDTDDTGDGHGEHSDEQRHLAAVQDEREQVAPELIGAEQVSVAERREATRPEVLFRRRRHGQDVDEHDRQHDEKRAHRADPHLHPAAAPAAGGSGRGQLLGGDGRGTFDDAHDAATFPRRTRGSSSG